jgi:alpha-glucosidase
MTTPTPWWRGAVGYQVYLRSFADADGDGIGDLVGVRQRLPHLAELGVDIVWITPCYPSPGADHGYDVSDYTDVALVFGGMAALDAVLADAHAAGMRVVLDLVPNHSSNRHPWFQRAVHDPTSPERDYYVWRHGSSDHPPNNWRSNFGGPAWTWEPSSEQWYLHRFLPEQPDLNWRNPAVHAEFDRILRFWFERGVDGFRIDVAHGLLVDEQFRDNPVAPMEVDDDVDPRGAFSIIEHVHDQDQPGVVDIYREWRRVAADHGAFLIGEVYLDDPAKVGRYVEDDALDAAFCFPALHTGWDAAAMRRALAPSVAAGRGRFAWPMSSHDDPRAGTRFGGGARGAERQLAYFTLLAALPGIPFLYQGDELGLENAVLPADQLADPVSVRHHGAPGRDGSRAPMLWEPGPGFGFTTGEPWLPFGSNRRPEHTVAAQTGVEGSILERTRRLLATRREATAMLAADDVEWLEVAPHVVGLRRGDMVVAVNVGGPDADLDLPRAAELVYTTRPGASVSGARLRLPTDVAVWCRLAQA